jgi:DNA invertase Pin-like site-specific DNA recombinase
LKIGYAIVSSLDQSSDLQLSAFSVAGCDLVFQDKTSSLVKDRPELTRMLAQLQKGDEVLVWRLDRLGRSLTDLVEIINELSLKSVSFSSVDDQIDTRSPTGNLFFQIFSSLAKFEKNLIKERTLAGLRAAKLKGKTGGKPKGLSEAAKATAQLAESLFREGHAVKLIATRLGISRPTVYKYLQFRKCAL